MMQPMPTNEHRFKHFELQELATGVYAAIAGDSGWAGANAGIVDLGSRTLIFDTFLTPRAIHELQTAAELVTGRPATLVINSHYHSDHTWGNQVFGPGIDLIATAGTRQLMQTAVQGEIDWYRSVAPDEIERIESLLRQEMPLQRRQRLESGLRYYQAALSTLPELRLRLPNVTFESRLTLFGSKRSAELVTFGGGHTRSDGLLHVPDVGVLFVGDLVTTGCHPYLPDGDPGEWMHILDMMRTLHPQTIMPGHGLPTAAETIDAMQQYITMINETALHEVFEVAEDTEEADAILTKLTPAATYASWAFSTFFAANVRFVYQRLETMAVEQ